MKACGNGVPTRPFACVQVQPVLQQKDAFAPPYIQAEKPIGSPFHFPVHPLYGFFTFDFCSY